MECFTGIVAFNSHNTVRVRCHHGNHYHVTHPETEAQVQPGGEPQRHARPGPGRAWDSCRAHGAYGASAGFWPLPLGALSPGALGPQQALVLQTPQQRRLQTQGRRGAPGGEARAVRWGAPGGSSRGWDSDVPGARPGPWVQPPGGGAGPPNCARLPRRSTRTRAITSTAPPSGSTSTAPSSTSSWNASARRTASPQSQPRRRRRTEPAARSAAQRLPGAARGTPPPAPARAGVGGGKRSRSIACVSRS